MDTWRFSEDWIGSPQDRSRYSSFRALCYFGAGLNSAQAAQLFGVDTETVASWGATDLAPPQIWRTLLALAGEFEAVNAAWKGWRIQKGKLYAPDLADGFTPGQIRALPYLQGALDAYRQQATRNRPDTSTAQEPQASAPVMRTAGKRRRTSAPPKNLERSPLGRGSGVKTPEPCHERIDSLPDQGTPTVRRDAGTSRRTVRAPALTGSAPAQPLTQPHEDRAASAPLQPPVPGKSDVKVTPLWRHQNQLQIQSLKQDPQICGPALFTLFRYIVKPQGRGAPKQGPAEAKTSPPTGAPALPVSLPASGSGRKRPPRKPPGQGQSRIIDIMLN